MPKVKFTSALKRFYPELSEIEVEADCIADLVKKVNEKFPKIMQYIVDENGSLRKHVNIFIGNTMIKDRSGLSDRIENTDDVFIMQALSGG